MKASNIAVLVLALVFSGPVVASPAPIPPPAVEVVAVSEPSLMGLGVMVAVAALFAIEAYKDSQRPARACEKEAPIAGRWVVGGPDFVTTACDFQSQGNKVVAVN